jgi:hypothetical protein
MYPKSEKKWLTRKEASIFLTQMGCPIAHTTLRKMAYMEEGPPYVKSGWRTVRYDSNDLIEWANSRMVKVVYS